jgi:AcrR family transcriptional regulator
MKADDRRGLILQAARRAFSETGDMSGTTMRAISEAAGVSEGLIYRHFESKEQLYLEAVVEPLREVTDRLVATAEEYNADRPETTAQRMEIMRSLTDDLVTTFTKILPLLGLVLFGDPKIARTFYRDDFAVAMDRLAAAWKSVEGRYGFSVEAPDISARTVMGICLMLALEQEHNPKFDRTRAVTLVTEGLAHGFFPPVTAGTDRATKASKANGH